MDQSAGKMDTSWTCDTCTFALNPSTMSACGLCGTPSSQNATWACKWCTLENPENFLTCEGCLRTCDESETNITNSCCDVREKTGARKVAQPAEPSQKRSELTEDLRQAEVEEAMSNWERIVNYCKKNEKPFVDDSFPPVPRSLHRSDVIPPRKVTQWLRPYELALSKDEECRTLQWTVFRDPSPSDILQGALGNCWLMSALAVVAERENLLKEIVVTREFSREGVYLIRLCKDGKWVTVMVDDLLPCDESGNLVYSRTKNKQLWVPLIEKAMAKIYGSYGALDTGNVVEGLSTLTGQPCESIDLENTSSLDLDLTWTRLLSFRQSKFLIGASTGDENEKSEEMGLHRSHAYSVLDVLDVDGCRLLRMRDPWGRSSWNGDWSDESEKWTPDLKQLLMCEESQSGAFWISFEDFLQFFDLVDICKIRDSGWNELRLYGHLPPLWCVNSSSCLLLTVLEPTVVEFTLFQRSMRNPQQDFMDFRFVVLEATTHISLLRVERLVDYSEQQYEDFVGLHEMLDSGVYFVVCMAFNHGESGTEDPEYSMAIHSSKPLVVEHGSPPPFILADTLIYMLLARGEKKEGCPNTAFYCSQKDWTGLVIMVENRNKDEYVQVECDCSESNNFISSREQYFTIDVIPPYSRQVINVLTELEEGKRGCVPRLSFQMLGRAPADKQMLNQPKIDDGIKDLHCSRPIM